MAIVGMNIMVQINFVLDDFDILLLKEDVWHSNDSSEQNCESWENQISHLSMIYSRKKLILNDSFVVSMSFCLSIATMVQRHWSELNLDQSWEVTNG